MKETKNEIKENGEKRKFFFIKVFRGFKNGNRDNEWKNNNRNIYVYIRKDGNNEPNTQHNTTRLYVPSEPHHLIVGIPIPPWVIL